MQPAPPASPPTCVLSMKTANLEIPAARPAPLPLSLPRALLLLLAPLLLPPGSRLQGTSVARTCAVTSGGLGLWKAKPRRGVLQEAPCDRIGEPTA